MPRARSCSVRAPITPIEKPNPPASCSPNRCARKWRGRSGWTFSEVEKHWDDLLIRSWATIGGERVLYQEGSVTSMRHPRELIALYTGRTNIQFVDGFAMYGGTLPAIGEIRWADEFEFAIEDPVLKRRLSHRYRVKSLPVEG